MLSTVVFCLISLFDLSFSCGERSHSGTGFNILNPFRSKRSIHNRIIGGSEAEEGAWPWHAIIRYIDLTDGNEYLCGGSLISRRHVLTAAHCTLSLNTNASRVQLGSTSMSSSKNVHVNIAKKFAHPLYSADETFNPGQLHDIAILTLASPVEESDEIGIICLSNDNIDLTDVYAYITGFGANNNGTEILPKASKNLQETLVPIVDNSICSEKWKDLEYYGGCFDLEEESQLCAGAVGHGTAQGDSGGPLMIKTDSGLWFQVGVTSFGLNEGKGYYDQGLAPGVYTRISYYCDFISTATEGEAKCSNSVVLNSKTNTVLLIVIPTLFITLV